MGKVKDAAKSAKDIEINDEKDTKSLSRKSSTSSLKGRKSAKGNELADSEILSKKEQRKIAKELAKHQELEDEDEDEEDSDEDEGEQRNMDKLLESDSDSEDDLNGDEDDDEDEDDEEEEDIPLSDVELDDDADVVPYEKTTVNNVAALKQAYGNIKLPTSKLPFFEHLSVESDGPIVMKDIYDDMERELCFYKQGLAAVTKARKQLLRDKVPFTRPTDYFAEMVKSDEHMDKLKKKMIEEESSKKASQEAKRQRELKKFGKKVQHAKLQERAKEKRDTLEKIKSLKRKRPGLTTDDDFDVAIEEAGESMKKEKSGKRKAKDAKYGSGGKKRFKKANDAKSSGDLSGFSQKKMKQSAPKKRLGKNKRMTKR